MKMINLYGKYLTTIALFLAWNSKIFSQHTFIPTGTTTDIDEIRKFGNVVVINGNYQFIVKCYDDCDELIPLTLPQTYYENSSLVLQDTNRFYVCSYNNSFINHQLVFKTIDGGQSWDSIFENPGSLYSMQLLVFDTNFISVSTGDFIYTTNDGGENWGQGQDLEDNTIGSSLRINDSMGIFGGSPELVFTTNKGVSWTHSNFITGLSSITITALDPDSIYLVSGDLPLSNTFSYIFGGFQSTRIDKYLPMLFPKGMYVTSKNEIYVVGRALPQNIGRIMKTTDLGETWTYYDVPGTTYLSAIVFLNDSIALIGGANGTLIKWNKNSPMTEINLGLEENKDISATLFPNPVSQEQKLEINTRLGEKIEIQLYDLQGRNCGLVYSGVADGDKLSISVNLSHLDTGIYVYRLQVGERSGQLRFVKQ